MVFRSAAPRLHRPEDDLEEVHDDIDSREIFGTQAMLAS